MVILWIILGIVIILLALYVGFIYNGFINKRNRIKNSLAQIDVQLKRRSDLIPNIIESVKGYVKHEKQLLTDITKARTSLINAPNIDSKVKANDQLTGLLKNLFAVSENYPDLKANTNFLQLQEELVSTENKVSYSRQHYNDNILAFNNTLESFPSNIIGKIFNFKPAKHLQITEAERKNVEVKF